MRNKTELGIVLWGSIFTFLFLQGCENKQSVSAQGQYYNYINENAVKNKAEPNSKPIINKQF